MIAGMIDILLICRTILEAGGYQVGIHRKQAARQPDLFHGMEEVATPGQNLEQFLHAVTCRSRVLAVRRVSKHAVW
jgi:hypothetical protein